MKKIWIALGILLALAVLVGVNLRQRGPRGEKVEIEKIQRRTVTGVVEASGRLRPAVLVDLSSDVIGRVVEIAVQEGAAVRKGDLLIRIDPSQYEFRVKSAEAALHAAESRLVEVAALVARVRADWERARGLHAERLVAESALDAARSAFAAAEAQRRTLERDRDRARAAWEEARDALAKTAIHSPMDGIVTRRNVEVGEVAVAGTLNNQGSLLMTVADLSVMRAEVDVDETDVVLVKEGQAAEVKLDAFPDRVFAGAVTEVARSAVLEAAVAAGQNRSADYQVKVTLKDSDPELRPGLSSTVRITTAVREGALAVPIQAVVAREPHAIYAATPSPTPAPATPAAEEGARKKDLEGAFLVEEGVARFREVKLGIAGERWFEVTAGLEEGDRVITGPFTVLRTLRDGDRVRAEERAAGAARDLPWRKQK